MPKSNGLQSIKLDLKKNPRVKVMKIEVLEGYEDYFTIHTFGVLWKIKRNYWRILLFIVNKIFLYVVINSFLLLLIKEVN